MNIAIYQYHRQDTLSQDMNQSAEHLILSAVTLCKEKAIEVYGEDNNFINYIDTESRMIESKCMKGATVRPRMEELLADIKNGAIDAVVVSYMGVIASDFNFVIAFYIYLCQNNCKLLTVREGKKINDMMEQALEEMWNKM